MGGPDECRKAENEAYSLRQMATIRSVLWHIICANPLKLYFGRVT
jgi:hypothetical protein